MTENEEKKSEEKYVEARVNGMSGEKAALYAGYSPNTRPGHIEQSHKIRTLMAKALEEKGLTEDYIAGIYRDGITASLTPGAKDKDINGLSQLLRQWGFLMGYGKKDPTVAVQINNNVTANQGDDNATTAQLIDQVTALMEEIKSELSIRNTPRVHEGDIIPPDSASHGGVAESSTEQESIGGGGQP